MSKLRLPKGRDAAFGGMAMKKLRKSVIALYAGLSYLCGQMYPVHAGDGRHIYK